MKPWDITLNGETFTDDTATVAHAIAVAELVGDDWQACSPWNGPKMLGAWLAVLLASRSGNLDKSLAAVYALPLSTFATVLTEREPEDDPPATAPV